MRERKRERNYDGHSWRDVPPSSPAPAAASAAPSPKSLAAEGASVIVADNGASIGGDGGDPERRRARRPTALGKKAIAFTDSVASPGVAKHLVELAVKQLRRHRHRGEQCRDPARRLRVPRRSARLGRGDPQQPLGAVLSDQRRLGGDARAGQVGPRRRRRLRLGPHRQHRLVGRPLRQSRPGGLCQRQGRPVRPDARDGDGPGSAPRSRPTPWRRSRAPASPTSSSRPTRRRRPTRSARSRSARTTSPTW